MTELFDTHCHLDLEPLGSSIEEVIGTARHNGVTRFLVPGVHPDAWERIIGMSQQIPGVYGAVGIHPMHALHADDDTLARLELSAPHCCAIGEIGLDSGYDIPLSLQEDAFRAQLELAIRLGLPVLIHVRRAFQRTLQILRESGASRVGGIMHAFSGSPEMAREFIRLGFAISLSGTVTWDSARRPKQLAREVPLEHLVLETDAPDLTPQPFRGVYNRPEWLPYIAAEVALIKGTTPEAVGSICTRNAVRLLRSEPGQYINRATRRAE